MSDQFLMSNDTPGPDPIVNAIFDFNERVIGINPTALNPLEAKQADWLKKFVEEELSEFREAFDQQDIVAEVDAVLDLVYGALGTLKKMGLTRQQVYECMMAVHRANMKKKRGDKGRGSDEDATKPNDFVPPEQEIGRILGLTRLG